MHERYNRLIENCIHFIFDSKKNLEHLYDDGELRGQVGGGTSQEMT